MIGVPVDVGLGYAFKASASWQVHGRQDGLALQASQVGTLQSRSGPDKGSWHLCEGPWPAQVYSTWSSVARGSQQWAQDGHTRN